MPLDADAARFIGTLAEGGGVLRTVVIRDDASRSQRWAGPRVLQEQGAPSGWNNDGFANETKVARTDEVIAPGDALRALLEPIHSAPPVAVELDDFLNEVPSPDLFAVRLDGIY